MKHSGQGIVKTGRGEEQPADKDRSQAAHRTDPGRSVSREETRDSKQTETKRNRRGRHDRGDSSNR